MKVIAWSQNLTDEKADAHGVTRVVKPELFAQSDFLSVHLVLSDRSRGIVDEQSLSLMKPSAFPINTSRGPIVDAQALLTAVTSKSIELTSYRPRQYPEPTRGATYIQAHWAAFSPLASPALEESSRCDWANLPEACPGPAHRQ